MRCTTKHPIGTEEVGRVILERVQLGEPGTTAKVSARGEMMQVVDHVVKAGAPESLAVIDSVALTWDERQKSRQKLRTAHGQEIALALPTGTRLHAGDLLPTTDGGIAVHLAPEEVLLIRPRSLQEAAFVAYQIGNRHLPLDIAADGLKILYQPVVESYFSQQQIPTERVRLPFTPVTATSGHH
jgi:urease accessory protein